MVNHMADDLCTCIAHSPSRSCTQEARSYGVQKGAHRAFWEGNFGVDLNPIPDVAPGMLQGIVDNTGDHVFMTHNSLTVGYPAITYKSLNLLPRLDSLALFWGSKWHAMYGACGMLTLDLGMGPCALAHFSEHDQKEILVADVVLLSVPL
jgi:hypothetical protein